MKKMAELWLPAIWVVPCVILLEGFISIAIEILTIRQLLPVAGGSVIVTSLIIGFFLLFLALGYHQGGKYQHHYLKILQRNFLLAGCWFGIGLSYLFVFFFYHFINRFTNHTLYSLCLYLTIIIAPLTYLLGQTIPITMNLVKSNQTIGRIGGYVLSLSTLGAFLGAITTSLILLTRFGVAHSIFFVFLLLIFLALIVSNKQELLWSRVLMAGILTGIIYSLNIKMENLFFTRANSYANYHILTADNMALSRDEKILVINDALSSYTNQSRQGFPYIEKIKTILFKDLNLNQADILVLGAGGFSLSAAGTHNNRFTYVDIDDQLKQIVLPKFLPTMNHQFISDDARHFLLRSHQQFAAIVSDTYTDIKAIPSQLLSKEYIEQIRDHLLPNGVAIFNIIANPTLSDKYSARIDNTIRHIFSQCMVSPDAYANRYTNILYVCFKRDHVDHKIYSDNWNNSTIDAFSW